MVVHQIRARRQTGKAAILRGWCLGIRISPCAPKARDAAGVADALSMR